MIESKKFKNPFPGLRPFETDEYRLFFGREGQSDALITRLQRSRLLAVVGTSGSGKSSLVRAGLLPALRGGMMADAGSGWRIAVMRPGSDPFSNLASALVDKDVLPLAGGGLRPAEAKAVVEATLQRGSLGLVDAVIQGRLTESQKLLIVVDQFEELFRFRSARATTSTGDDASAFVKLLLEAARQRELSVYVVLTMRSDFLGDCAQFQGLPEAINDGQYLIPRMTRDERRIAITGPIGVARGRIAEPLVSRLLNDVGDNPDQLPILQHALMRTWDYWAIHRRNSEPLGLEHYQAIGTMDQALSVHADEAYDILDDRSKRIAELLFKALTERGADNREIRRPTRLSEICDIAGATVEEVVAVIEVFRYEGCSFLMPPVSVPLTPDTIIDISHESLIRNWTRLQKWVDEEAQSSRIYRRLAEAAVLHSEGSEGLLKNPALQIALDWRAPHKPNAAWARRYNAEFAKAMAFLDASKAAHEADMAEEERQRAEQLARERRELELARDFAEKQTRSARRMRLLAAGMAVMFLLSLVAAGYAIRAGRQASFEKTNAEKSARDAGKSAQSAMDAQETAVNTARDLTATNARLKDEKKKTDDALAEVELAVASQKKALEAQQKSEAFAREKWAEAETNLKSFHLSVNRNSANAVGTAAYQREDYGRALESFREVLRILDKEQARPNDESTKDVLTVSRVASLSNQGATERRLGESDQIKLREAVNSYEEAKAISDEYKKRKAGILDDDAKWTSFDVLHGLAHAYRDRAVSVREEFNRREEVKFARERAGNVREGSSSKPILPAEVKEDLEKAEKYFTEALTLQEELLKGTNPARLAASYEDFAQGYLDSGKFDKAKEKFERAIELRRLNKQSSELNSTERAALAAALRKLGELYQSQEGHYDDAVRTFNEMITLQEDIPVEELAQQGQAIANSYIDLGQIHAAKGESAKAEDAFRAASVLQRTALKLQRREKLQPGSPQEKAIVKELVADFDELGDAFVKLGKYNDAEVLYLTALTERYELQSDLEKSYDKLTKLYRRHMKEYLKAEEYNQLLLKFYEDKPRSAQYADALVQLAALYSEMPDRFAAAESNYKHAREIYQEQHDWWNENVILYRLARLYDKQKKVTEREQTLRARVDTLTKYFNQLANPAGLQPRDPVTLVSEYLYAVNALAYFYKDKNNAEAESAYQRALWASPYITSKIYNEKVLKFYAATLGDYRKLLNKLDKKGEAAKVAEVAQGVEEKLSQDEERKQQNAVLVQQSLSESTSPPPQ